MATASDVLRIAAGEIGYSRWTDPQPGTRYGRWYAQSHGSYYGASGVPFCAMFVSWVMSRAGQPFPGLPAAYRALRAVSRTLPRGQHAQRPPGRPRDLQLGRRRGGPHRLRGGQPRLVHPDHRGQHQQRARSRRTRAWNTVAAILRPRLQRQRHVVGRRLRKQRRHGQLAVDGSCGPATIRKWQQVMGTTVDGIISGQVRPDGRTWGRPALVDSCVRYGGGGSNLIRAVQHRLNLTADGCSAPPPSAPSNSTSASRRTHGSAPAPHALQTRLNTGRF